MLEFVPHVVPADDAVVGHGCGAGEHRHYVWAGTVFLETGGKRVFLEHVFCWRDFGISFLEKMLVYIWDGSRQMSRRLLLYNL